MKIVSLFPSATETLFELGLWDQVVGITAYCTMPRNEVKKKTRVGGTKTPDLNRIVELKPDVVVMNAEENRKEDASELQKRGITVHVTHPAGVSDSVQMIAEYGRDFGAPSKSAEICAEIRDRIRALRIPRTYRSLVLIWSDGEGGQYMTAAQDTYVHAICGLFGMKNVVDASGSPYPGITVEEMARLNPEVVLLPDEPFAFRPKHVARLKEQLPEIVASRNDFYLLFNGMYATWHGYGTLRALREFPAVLRESGLW